MSVENGVNEGTPGKLNNFSNVLSAEELDEFEKNIENGCEQIDYEGFSITPFDQ